MNVRPLHLLLAALVASPVFAAPALAPDAAAWIKGSGYPRIATTADKAKVTFRFAQLGGSKTDCAVRSGYAYVLVSQRKTSPACLFRGKSTACREVAQDFEGNWTTGTPVCGGGAADVDVALAAKTVGKEIRCQANLDCNGEVFVSHERADGKQVYHTVKFETVNGIVQISSSQTGIGTKPKI
jgi:hypothetical protein